MELPQPRSYGTEGRRAKHEFLSLYSRSTIQQDPTPPSQAGAYLKTRDFLQPLEYMAKEESPADQVSAAIEKPPPSVEHILPGGVGSYTISHISYFNQRAPKPEATLFTVADDNSNCSSHSGSGFALWQQSSAEKGKTGKEKLEHRTPQSSPNYDGNSFSSLSYSQPLGKKSRSFMDMIKSAKVIARDEEDFDDEEEFVLKKEASSTHGGEVKIKVDGRSNDQKANTPRSKHSATEQRRRSKINDRFQMLRELIPHSEQKRDKASFLLEVIEYIQYLQQRVNKYDESYQGRIEEPANPMPQKNNHMPAEGFIDQSRRLNIVHGPALVFGAKLDEPVILGSAQNTVESVEERLESATMQSNIFAPVRNNGALLQFQPRDQSESQNSIADVQRQSCNGEVGSEKMEEEDMEIEGGSISVSSAYSRGLLKTLTQALQSSGVDLSQASISVQIELGKPTTLTPSVKGYEAPRNQGTRRSQVNHCDASEQALKRGKTSMS